MPTAVIKSQSPAKPQTPFLRPPWAWNVVPAAGVPIRVRCQSVVSDSEREAAAQLVADYRAQEEIAAANDIESRERDYSKIGVLWQKDAVRQETLRREMAACDHGKFLDAQGKLAELRGVALSAAVIIVKRLIQSLNDELNATALATESRLDAAGLEIRVEKDWLLHDDLLCKALWSCRTKAEKLLAETHAGTAVGILQYFCTNEERTPFTWP